MTHRRIEHRTNPVVIPDSELLPVQRKLLNLEHPDPEQSSRAIKLSDAAIRSVGHLFQRDVVRVIEETHVQANERGETTRRMLQQVSILAQNLIDYNLPTNQDERADRSYTSTTANAYILNGYQSWGSDYDGPRRYFTPQGFVYDPDGELKQKLILLRVNRKTYFPEDPRFDYSVSGEFGLYTNNLAEHLPLWEYENDAFGVSDMYPASQSYPYDLHAQPRAIPSIDVAESIVNSVENIIK
jgi:hypothetical protein